VTDELQVLLDGVDVGRVTRSKGRTRFTYESAWRDNADSFPLSLSLPLARSEHAHAAIEAFMWGLLPDNERTLERWAKRFQVSARSAFSLLAHVGEDCAGAAQFVRADRLAEVRGAGPAAVDWLTEREVGERLRALRQDQGLGRLARDTGQFSLAGAQPKTALLFDGKRWGVPAGRTPTTHILKPPTADLDGHVENEHLCLMLARALGLPTALSDVLTFESEQTIAIERYDRLRMASPAQRAVPSIRRLHQEDLCQALGVMPGLKYQSEGGPTPRAIAELLRLHSSRASEDLSTFLDALILNWLIAGTDAHAKNYSLLIGSRSQVRLAPLYDLGSALPYPDIDQRRLKLAMKLGGTYQIRRVSPRDFEKLARELELEPDRVVERARALARQLREKLPVVHQRLRGKLEHRIVERLALVVDRHAKSCADVLGA
jgi:serine/threonine-protein kinase HipA